MAAPNNLAIVNRDSGEVLNPNPSRPYSFKSRSHMVVGQEFGNLGDCDLTALESKIIAKTMHDLCDGKYHPLDLTQLASDLGHNRKNISVAVKRLVVIGFYIRQPGPVRPASYMVNPAIAFRGSGLMHAAAVRQYGRELTYERPVKKPAAVADTAEEATR